MKRKKYDSTLEYPDILTASYEASDKSRGMVLANYLHDQKEVVLDGVHKVWTNPESEDDFVMTDRVIVKPLSAVIVEI
jgi:hypothetical protein